jgi:hypothetical protein
MSLPSSFRRERKAVSQPPTPVAVADDSNKICRSGRSRNAFAGAQQWPPVRVLKRFRKLRPNTYACDIL